MLKISLPDRLLAVEIIPVLKSRRQELPNYPELLKELESYQFITYVDECIREWILKLAALEIHEAGVSFKDNLVEYSNERHKHIAFHTLFQCKYDRLLKISGIQSHPCRIVFSLVRFYPYASLPTHGSERKFLVERITQLLSLLEHRTGEVRWAYIEAQATSTLQIQEVTGSRSSTYHVDVLGCSAENQYEVVFVEQSGGPTSRDQTHCLDDSEELINEAINGLRAILCENLDAPIKSAGKLRTYCIQVIRDRVTLLAVQIIGPNKYAILELKSARFPNDWEHLDLFIDVLELAFCLVAEMKKQKQARKTLRLESRSHSMSTTETRCREWLTPVHTRVEKE
ncbi:uncharacterized protein EV422DRAFT_105323 [Fimicolochytrium jonesii]|uniref:uncharacterized protein n=1 Tax=Fimicolochytrium jonesii TaxID=1396493 RepID=UPI0022FDEB5F|nr:uncharacterized protein EV422DRAFT_105323 [Fimicolochytrium jonesii]KAI8819741.1 hypothetical protein EV422DRAFT_105323 [Fimicolochytrium jonesii]